MIKAISSNKMVNRFFSFVDCEEGGVMSVCTSLVEVGQKSSTAMKCYVGGVIRKFKTSRLVLVDNLVRLSIKYSYDDRV